jgi:hypothetical protein
MIRTVITAARIVTAVVLVCTASYAATIFTTPPSLAPGTQYQLAFVTDDGFLANSTSISDYNTDVTNEVALNATLAAFSLANSVTWTVIGSTPSVDANVNAPSTGLVYTLDGTEVASGGLYGGSLLAPIDIDQNGNTLSGIVWTGSNTSGTAANGINDLGQDFPEIGASGLATGSWIASENGIVSNNTLSLYALSSVITVPEASGVPEPATIALVPVALLVLFGIDRRRRKLTTV